MYPAVLLWVVTAAIGAWADQPVTSTSSPASTPGDPVGYEILILNSYHSEYQWTENYIAAIKKQLASSGSRFEFFVEYMDTKRLRYEGYFHDLYEFFKRKYHSRKFDLIFASDDNAFLFLEEYHDKLFQDVPVVVSGVAYLSPEAVAGLDSFTGVRQTIDVQETVELILKLHPNTRTFYIVSDNSPTGFSEQELIRIGVTHHFPELNVVYLDGRDLTTAELLQKLRTLSKDSAVILTVWSRDKTGAYIPLREVGPQISQASPVPVYGVTDIWLGLGIVGGKLYSGTSQGTIAAEIGLKILDGTQPADIPVITRSFNPYKFDYVQLERFGIPLSELPPESIIINRHISIYQQYKRTIWTTVAVILLQGVTILFLLINMVMRRRAERELNRMFILSNDLLCLSGFDGYLKRTNPSFIHVLGWSQEELLDQPWLNLLHPEDQAKAQEAFKKCLGGEEFCFIENRWRCRDGSWRWIFWNGVLLKEERRFFMVGRDITERREAEDEIRLLNEQLEQRVRQRTYELELANGELEAFTSAVSHDLKAPVRSINGFCQFLQADYSDRLDETGKDLLKRVSDAGVRMGELIEGLLKLSRLSTYEITWEPVNLSDLAHFIANELRERAPGRRADFVIQPDITVRGDRVLLRAVLENLLGNAWKFTSQKEEAAIEFGRKMIGDKEVYFIRDNGAGFNMAYAENLFLPFRRLHKPGEYEGTGIGLATVKRIINRHGGEIWGEGEEGRGATFYFTISEPPA